MLIRFPDWPSRLETFLNTVVSQKFAYSRFDCCTFVADAIEAETGIDIAKLYRGRYSTRAEALKLGMDLAGAPTVQAIAEKQAERHGMPEIPVLSAARGDMVLLKRPRDYSLGLVAMDGRQVLIAGKFGWGPVPIDRACRAWRV